MRSPLEVAASGFFEHDVVILRTTHIPGLADIADPLVSRLVCFADLLGAVCRAVVGNDQLEVGEGLSENRGQSLLQIILAIVNRQPNSNHGRRNISTHLGPLAD